MTKLPTAIETKIISLARADNDGTAGSTVAGIEICSLQTFAKYIESGWGVALEHAYGITGRKHVVLCREIQYDEVDNTCAPSPRNNPDDPLIGMIDTAIEKLRNHGLPTPRTCGALVSPISRSTLLRSLNEQLTTAGLSPVAGSEEPVTSVADAANSVHDELCRAIGMATGYKYHRGLSSASATRIRKLARAIIDHSADRNLVRYEFLRDNIAKTPDDVDNWHGFAAVSGDAFDQLVDASIRHYRQKNDT